MVSDIYEEGQAENVEFDEDSAFKDDSPMPGAAKFTAEYEAELFHTLRLDKEVFASFFPQFDPGIFGNKFYVQTGKFLKDYWAKYKTLPSKAEILQNIKGSSKSDTEYFEAGAYVFPHGYQPTANPKAVLDGLREYATAKTLKALMTKTATGLDKNSAKYAEHIDQLLTGLRELKAVDAPKERDCYAADELASLDDPEWLVDDWFEKNSTGSVFGGYGSLKTFLMVGMAVDVALGRLFLGLHATHGDGRDVVYVASEGEQGYKKRIAAFAKHWNVKAPANLKFVFKRFNMGVQNGAAELIEYIKEKKWNPGLVVIDTLAKNIVGVEDGEVMGNFANSLTDIRKAFPGCCATCVHHAGKNEEAKSRGHTSLPSGIDTNIEIKKMAAGGVRARFDKQKDDADGVTYYLDEVLVDLGTSTRGRKLSSLVLVPRTVAGVPMSKDQQKRYEEHEEERQVVSLLPRIKTADANNTSMMIAISALVKKLGSGWDRFRVHRVLERIKDGNLEPGISWRSTSDKKNARVYYYVDLGKIDDLGGL